MADRTCSQRNVQLVPSFIGDGGDPTSQNTGVETSVWDVTSVPGSTALRYYSAGNSPVESDIYRRLSDGVLSGFYAASDVDDLDNGAGTYTYEQYEFAFEYLD